MGDPIGLAIQEYASKRKPADVIVKSDICEDDIIPVEVLFRSYDDMPELERQALDRCEGSVLDVGSGAGVHAQFLKENGCEVTCIDISPGAVKHLQSIGLKAQQVDFFELKDQRFDTILMLMNGIGIAGKLSNLANTLNHAKSLLNEGSNSLRFLRYQVLVRRGRWFTLGGSEPRILW